MFMLNLNAKVISGHAEIVCQQARVPKKEDSVAFLTIYGVLPKNTKTKEERVWKL